MLDPLQEQLRAIVDRLPEGREVALAGGGALIVRGVVTRPTRDLDYFGTSQEAVDELADALEGRLAAQGFSVERLQSSPRGSRGSGSARHRPVRRSTRAGTLGSFPRNGPGVGWSCPRLNWPPTRCWLSQNGGRRAATLT